MINSSVKYHDQNSANYDKSYKNPYWKIYKEITWNYIKDYLPPTKKRSLILDAGGGTGEWAIRLAKLGYNVVLADVSEGMLDVAVTKIKKLKLGNKITVMNLDICKMHLLDSKQFNLSLAEGDPVSYCSNPNKAISELSRVTKIGGYVTVSVDNKLRWVSGLIKNGHLKEAQISLKSGIGYMRAGHDDQFPAHMFTIEELSVLSHDPPLILFNID
ncbi:MAG: class I SAM-dependent methyltransferase [Oligoflexia bacterium]|nr:class I SAM-dependent methyltransferase [Oligoflexia bacterium]